MVSTWLNNLPTAFTYSTTGGASTDTYVDGATTYRYVKWTGTGSLITSQARR